MELNKNELIMQIITTTSRLSTQKDLIQNYKEHETYDKNSLFDGKKVNVINHKTSATFFTDEYLHLLQTILQSPEIFNNKTLIEKYCVQSDIESLSHDDYNLKMYLNRSSAEPMLNEIFPENYYNFKKDLDKIIFNPIINTQKGDSATFKYKLRLFYKEIIQMLIHEGYDFERINSLTEKEVDEICKVFISSKEIFNLFSIVMLKSAKDSLFASKTNVFDENSMFVSKHKIVYTIYINTLLLCLSHCIFYKLVYRSRKGVPIESLLRSINTFIIHNIAKIMSKSSTKTLTDSIASMLNCFINCGIFINVTNEQLTHNKTQTKLYFPNKLSNLLGKFTVPPRVVQTQKITINNLFDYIIPSSFGTMKITKSKNLLDTLNISNSKQFKINSNFLNILLLLEEKYPHLEINRPIPSHKDVMSIKDKRDMLEINYNKFAFIFIKNMEQEFVKHHKQLKIPCQYRYAANLTVAETRCLSEWRIISEKYYETILERKSGLTRLEMARLMEGFPLYYTNTICSTTRFFAREYILSKHIGCLKLLRCDGKERKITMMGIIHILLAYYNEDTILKTKFHEYLRREKGLHTKNGLKRFYLQHRINYAVKDAVTYYMLLSVELTKIFNGGVKTSLMLQLDQVSSGLAFMAILFKNDELAYRTFVNKKDDGTEKKSIMYDDEHNIDSTYDYAMKSFNVYYMKNITHKNEHVCELFTTNKKIHQYALMCYSYNQTNYGRTQDFVKKFKEVYGLSPDKMEWDCINEISNKYVDFVNELFPNLNSLIELLNDMVELVVTDAQCIRVRSLDGEIIEWQFFKKKRKIRKAFNPIDMSAKGYSLTTAVVNKNGTLVPDMAQYKTKFLSYLVHSMDSAIMRKIIREMKKIKGTSVVDQLHDCVMVHVNDVQHFYDVVYLVYTAEELKDYLNTHVFAVFKQSISLDKQEELDNLIKRFEKLRNKQEKIYVPDHLRMYSFKS